MASLDSSSGASKPLAFQPLTADLEQKFLTSFVASCDRYRGLLSTLQSGGLSLSDTDLDTGRLPTHGANTLADKTYDELISKLRRRDAAELSPVLRRALAEHYDSPPSPDSPTGSR